MDALQDGGKPHQLDDLHIKLKPNSLNNSEQLTHKIESNRPQKAWNQPYYLV